MRLLLALLTTLALLAMPAAAAAQAPQVTFTTNKAAYDSIVDGVAHVSVAGLTSCAGQFIQLGLFAGAGAPDQVVTVVIDEGGAATTQVPLPVVNGTELRFAGVTGDPCIPGGTVISNDPITVSEPAEQPPVSFSSDRTEYVRQLNPTALLNVRSLRQCNNQLVQIGFYTAAKQPVGDLVGLTVHVLPGSADSTVAVPVPRVTATVFVGVTGHPCIPGGTIISSEPISVVDHEPADQPPVTLTTDKITYNRATGDQVAVVSVENLRSCAGKEIKVGLFRDADSPVSLAGTTVGADGRASAGVPIPANLFSAVHAGVTGDACIPAGTVISPEMVSVFDERDVTRSPVPPPTGSGLGRRSSVPPWVVGIPAILAGATTAGALLSQRRRR
jgi:hypothetical protein